MNQRSIGIVGIGATALGLAVALAPSVGAAARPVTTPASEFVVVLECPGVTQQVAPDATGKFVFKDVPAGSCRVSVTPASSTDAVAPVAMRDSASGMATGKRMHKPLSFHMVLDRTSAAAATATADDGSSQSATVVVQQKVRELRGHVTLLK